MGEKEEGEKWLKKLKRFREGSGMRKEEIGKKGKKRG